MAKKKQFPYKGARVKIIGQVGGYPVDKHMGELGTLTSVRNRVGTIFVMPDSVAKVKADNPDDPFWSSLEGFCISLKDIEEA